MKTYLYSGKVVKTFSGFVKIEGFSNKFATVTEVTKSGMPLQASETISMKELQSLITR